MTLTDDQRRQVLTDVRTRITDHAETHDQRDWFDTGYDDDGYGRQGYWTWRRGAWVPVQLGRPLPGHDGSRIGDRCHLGRQDSGLDSITELANSVRQPSHRIPSRNPRRAERTGYLGVRPGVSSGGPFRWGAQGSLHQDHPTAARRPPGGSSGTAQPGTYRPHPPRPAWDARR